MALLDLDIDKTGIALVALTALVLCYSAQAVVTWYRLRHIPGPFLASFSYLWLGRVTRSTRQWYIYRDLPKQYGSPLVRVGPNEISTDDPEIIRKMSAVRSPYGKDSWYMGSRFNPYGDTMFTTLDVAAHDRQKAKTASAYSGRDTTALEDGVDDQVRELVALIRRRYLNKEVKDSGGPHEPNRLLDFSKIISFFTMDVITRAGFGQEFGYLKADEDLHSFLRSVRDNWAVIAVTLDVPWIRSVLYSNWFLRWFGPRTTDKAGMGKVMAVAEKLVGDRFRPDSKAQRDMLRLEQGAFMAHGLTQKECETEGLFMVIAGSDTTASVVRSTMLHLMASPRVYNKLKREVRKAVDEGRASSPITFEEAKGISYLQAIIYEGLRIRAPAPGLYPKSVPPGGDWLHGQFIPEGTAIGMNTAALTRSKALFGDDADLFRPERFEEVDAAARTRLEHLTELVFGYGRTMCAGKPIAFMELNKVFFELLRAFDFQLANPSKPWDSKSYAVWVEENMWVCVTESQST
ncbi:Fumagillin dodecapentaenoate synthase [Apiospora rasikravindrae]|uniref:Fumagillin dodecapentaenoate synthase n=1 Tax=Apiospora rasikravindrae TaxID=990691 RepID=A0ABR1U9I5_9PEZI